MKKMSVSVCTKRQHTNWRGNPMALTWIIIAVAAVVVLAVIFLYNKLVRLRNTVRSAWSDIDVQLKKRYDLVPNLVETVKGYATHEQSLFTKVTQCQGAGNPGHGSHRNGKGRKPAAGFAEEPVCRCRGLSRPEGEPGLFTAADPAQGNRRQYRGRASLLQRRGQGFQHRDRAVPFKPDRLAVRVREA